MQTTIISRPIEPKDYPFVLRVNEENVEVLAPMDEEQLKYFAENAEIFNIFEVDGKPAAFIIVFREGTDYDSPNYRWFCEHYDTFLYVDRIVIDKPFRGLGLGRKMYGEVFAHANETNITKVTAEIDTEPVYNDGSLKFHKAMGFEEVGTQYVRNGEIRVSLQKAEVEKRRNHYGNI